MKKLISFSSLTFIILMMVSAQTTQAQVIVRPFAPFPIVAGVGMAAYPPYGGGYGRGFHYVHRGYYPMHMGGYYGRPRLYGRGGRHGRGW